MRVFIVEDSLIISERLDALLSDLHGVEVVGHAKDVEEAINSVRVLRPDVVILDIQIPGGSGFSALRQIRQSELPVVVIIFTNNPFPQYRQRCLDAGADFFLDKTTEFEELWSIFKGLVKAQQSNVEEVLN